MNKKIEEVTIELDIVRDGVIEALGEWKNNPLPDKGIGYTIPKEMGWGKMIEIMERHGAIPGDWRHFMQDCDTEISEHVVPEVMNCPSCGSNDLVSGKIDLEFLTCPVECNKCGHEWNDVYKYVGIQEVSCLTSF
jgi:predicted Zn-ribbon and HTH transcriptional regulator